MYVESPDQSNAILNASNFPPDAVHPLLSEAVTSPLIADTVHDLCNLVTNFQMYLYLIQRSPNELVKHLTELENFANYLDALVQNLKLANEPELEGLTQAPEPLNMNEIVARVIKAYVP